MIRSAAIAACCALAAACADTTIVDPMERQPKGRAFAINPFFEDGRAMRTPPAGTVPRERIVQNPALTQGRVGENDVTEFPIAPTRALLESGHRKFDIYCATCHGLVGDGRSPVAANMSLRLPPNLHERWAVVAYLRALQISQNAPLALAPPDVREKLAREKR